MLFTIITLHDVILLYVMRVRVIALNTVHPLKNELSIMSNNEVDGGRDPPVSKLDWICFHTHTPMYMNHAVVAIKINCTTRL